MKKRFTLATSLLFVTAVFCQNPPVAVNDTIEVEMAPFHTKIIFDPRVNDSDPDGDSFSIYYIQNAIHAQIENKANLIVKAGQAIEG